MDQRLHDDFKLWCENQGHNFSNFGFDRATAPGYVDAILARPRDASKGIVVIAHGTGNDCIYPQMSLYKLLLDSGYAVFGFDLDGHGQGSSTILDPQTITSCLPRAVEVARDAIPDHKVHLIGHSLGGALVMDFLASQPIFVVSATVVSVPLYIPQSRQQLLGEVLGILSPAILRQFPHYGLLRFLPAIGSFRRESFPVRIHKGTGLDSDRWDYVRQVTKIFEGLDLASSVRSIDAPLLLIYGDYDRISPVDHGEVLYENLADCELVTIAGETHFTALLSKPCEDKILQWLNRH